MLRRHSLSKTGPYALLQGRKAAPQARFLGAHPNFDDMTADEDVTHRALDLLGSKRNDSYEAPLAELREDTQA